MNIHGLRGPERLRPVNTFQSFTFDGRPDAITSRIRRDRIVRSPSPQNPLREKSLQRYQTKRALRTKIAGVIIANPPCERRLQLRVSRIVFVLQPSHGIDGMIGGRIAVDDSVADRKSTR